MSTARPTALSRHSTSKPAPPPVKAHPTSLLHPTCTLTGTHPITLSAHSIIQLRTRLVTTHAPISVAEGAIISERCQIGFQSGPSSSSSASSSPPPPANNAGDEEVVDRPQDSGAECTVGRHVVIESGAVVEAKSIGAYAVIGAGARLGKGCVVGDGAKICPLVEVGEGVVVRPGEVVWGAGWGERRVDGGMGIGRDGVRVRKEAVEGLGEMYRKLWTGK